MIQLQQQTIIVARRGGEAMLMTDGEVKDLMAKGSLVIGQYKESMQGPCSYDARMGKQALVSKNDKLLDISDEQSLKLDAGDFALVMTEESFTMPLDVGAQIGMKSALAREGLILLAGMHIEPGFKGHLRLGLYNCSGRPITIDYLDPVCAIEFRKLAKSVKNPPPEYPELVEGRIPKSDKAFFREMETTSLSDMAKELRTLSISTTTLTTVTYRIILPLLIGILIAALGAVIALICK
jgi:dCTP deaminase